MRDFLLGYILFGMLLTLFVLFCIDVKRARLVGMPIMLLGLFVFVLTWPIFLFAALARGSEEKIDGK